MPHWGQFVYMALYALAQSAATGNESVAPGWGIKMKTILVRMCSIALAAIFLRGVFITTDWRSRIAGIIITLFFLSIGMYDLLQKRFRFLHIQPGSRKDLIAFMCMMLVLSFLFGIGTYTAPPDSVFLKVFLWFGSLGGCAGSIIVIFFALRRPK